MVRLAHDVGVDRITAIRGEFSPWGYANEGLRPRSEVAAILYQAQQVADELGVEIEENILRHSSRLEEFLPGLKRANGYCHAFWNSVRLDYQGHIMLCCFSPVAADWSYGSVLDMGFERIWNGDIFRDVRQKANIGAYVTKACVTCRPVLPIRTPMVGLAASR